MKKILLFLLFLPVVLSAQSGDPVSDTSYFQKQGSLFFEVKTAIYVDGSELTTKTAIGDSAALVRATKDRITTKAAALAADARWVSTSRQRVTTLMRENDAVTAQTGTDPQKQVEIDYSAPFLVAGWKIKNGTTQDVVFSMSAQNNLRYSIAGAAVKQVDLLGAVIRLKNFTGTTDVDLYQLKPNGRWVNLDRTVTLVPPGGGD